MLWRKTLLRCYLSVRHFLSRPKNLRFLVNRNLFKHARTDESSFSAVSQIENPHYPYPTFLSFDQIDKNILMFNVNCFVLLVYFLYFSKNLHGRQAIVMTTRFTAAGCRMTQFCTEAQKAHSKLEIHNTRFEIHVRVS